MEEYRMKNSALLVIDLQNDITKNYREIIEKVNAAIEWAVQMDLFTFSTTTCPREQEHSSTVRMAQSLSLK